MSRQKQIRHNGSLGSAGQPDSVSEKAVGFPPHNARTANFADGTAPYVRRLAELAAAFDVLGELRNVEGNEESQSNWIGRDAGCHDACVGKRARGARPSTDCAVRWEGVPYFGASEATIASKRGSPRSGSHVGLRRKWP
jgi:hypothetical protein